VRQRRFTSLEGHDQHPAPHGICEMPPRHGINSFRLSRAHGEAISLPFEWLVTLWTAHKDLADYESKLKPLVPLAMDLTGHVFGVKRFSTVINPAQ
jgi:hypothetical protein